MGHANTSPDLATAILGYGFTTHAPGPIWSCDSAESAREIAEAPHLRAMQRTADGWVEMPVDRSRVTLTKTAVTLYDIQTDQVWDWMSHLDAERDLAASRSVGDTIQEYDTTDRDGNPLRVVLQIGSLDIDSPDMGGVYEFTR